MKKIELYLVLSCYFLVALTQELSPQVVVNTVETKVVNGTDPKATAVMKSTAIPEPSGPSPCGCGVYLNGQFTRGKPPKSFPVVMHEFDDHFSCNSIGGKQCQNKCLEVMIKHLSNSHALICAATDRDIHKERAYLFIKNCDDHWTNTNFSAGKEFCCKNGQSYICPVL